MIPLALTGFGAVSPLGMGFEAFGAGYDDPSREVFSTTSDLFDLGPYPGARVAEVRGFDAAKILGDKGLRNNDRLTKLYLVAARDALAHAGLKSGGAWTLYGPDDVGVAGANAYGSLEAIHELNLVARLEDPRYISPARFPNTVINSSLGYVSIWDDLRAFNATVVNGPAGALDAVGCAAMYLASKRAKAALVGGGEALSELLHFGLHRTGMLDGGAVSGEGAAFAVMEPLAAARARGATVHARVAGYGNAFESPEGDALFAPSSLALERAIGDALAEARIEASQVELVLTGASSWAPMDAPEAKALDASLPGARREAVKARTGETLGASGAFAMAVAARRLASGAAKTVVIPALGFFGNASALVLRRAEDE